LGTNTSVNKQIFNCLALFKNLNALYLSFDNNSVGMSCESLKELKQLTHLRVRTLKMNDYFFKGVWVKRSTTKRSTMKRSTNEMIDKWKDRQKKRSTIIKSKSS
jgi:hypothetical protein